MQHVTYPAVSGGASTAVYCLQLVRTVLRQIGKGAVRLCTLPLRDSTGWLREARSLTVVVSLVKSEILRDYEPGR